MGVNDIQEQASRFSLHILDGREYVHEIRMHASDDLNLINSPSLLGLYLSLHTWHELLIRDYETLIKIMIGEDFYNDLREMTNLISEMRDALGRMYNLMPSRVIIRMHFLNPEIMKNWVSNLDEYMKNANRLVELLLEYNSLQMKYTNRDGCWIMRRVSREAYSFASYLRDLALTFHYLLDFLSRHSTWEEAIRRRVYYFLPVNEYLVNLAKEWWYSVERLHSIYDLVDFNALKATILSNTINVVISPRENRKVDIYSRVFGIEVVYYDNIDEVLEVIEMLANDLGCLNVFRMPYEYIQMFCPKLRRIDLRFMKYLLPFIPSMDLRIHDPGMWERLIPRDILDNIENMARGNPVKREYLACKWAIENVLVRGGK